MTVHPLDHYNVQNPPGDRWTVVLTEMRRGERTVNYRYRIMTADDKRKHF